MAAFFAFFYAAWLAIEVSRALRNNSLKMSTVTPGFWYNISQFQEKFNILPLSFCLISIPHSCLKEPILHYSTGIHIKVLYGSNLPRLVAINFKYISLIRGLSLKAIWSQKGNNNRKCSSDWVCRCCARLMYSSLNEMQMEMILFVAGWLCNFLHCINCSNRDTCHYFNFAPHHAMR